MLNFKTIISVMMFVLLMTFLITSHMQNMKSLERAIERNHLNLNKKSSW